MKEGRKGKNPKRRGMHPHSCDARRQGFKTTPHSTGVVITIPELGAVGIACPGPPEQGTVRCEGWKTPQLLGYRSIPTSHPQPIYRNASLSQEEAQREAQKRFYTRAADVLSKHPTLACACSPQTSAGSSSCWLPTLNGAPGLWVVGEMVSSTSSNTINHKSWDGVSASSTELRTCPTCRGEPHLTASTSTALTAASAPCSTSS